MCITVPVTTYILGPNNEDTTAMFQEDSEICPNVYYIGKRGLYVTTNGLKIAYISGTYNNEKSRKDYQYSFEDALFLRDVCIKGSDNFRGVDILLTSQWPTNIIPNDKLKVRFFRNLINLLQNDKIKFAGTSNVSG